MASSVQAAALRGVPPRFAEFLTRAPHPVGPDSAHGRLLAGEPVVHIADVAEDEAYRSGDPTRRTPGRDGRRPHLALRCRCARTAGFSATSSFTDTEVRPFTDKQIALLQNFAAQAVIAMENARLLGELRQRTDDLQESLEYQTATSDVLKVISQSAFDLRARACKRSSTTAVRLCRADSATIYRNEGGEYRWAAGHMLSPELRGDRARTSRSGPDRHAGRARGAGAAAPFRFDDAWTDPLYEAKDDARVGGVHTMLGVPLLREGVPIGVIGLARRRVEAFYRARDRSRYDLCRPGGDRDRECAAVRRIARSHRRARALGRRAEDAGRGRAGGQLDARSEGGAVDDPDRLARDDLGDRRGGLSLHPGRARLPAGRGGGVGRGVVGLGRRSARCRDRDRDGRGDSAAALRSSSPISPSCRARRCATRPSPPVCAVGADRAAGRRRARSSARWCCSAAKPANSPPRRCG